MYNNILNTNLYFWFYGNYLNCFNYKCHYNMAEIFLNHKIEFYKYNKYNGEGSIL